MKVLFLSVSTGSGHLKAAKALGEYIKTRDRNSEILIIDTLDYASPIINKIIVKTYMNMLRLTPKVYGKIYNASDANSNLIGKKLNQMGSFINAFFSSKINKLVNEFKPDIVVSTHPFSLQMINKIEVPTIAVLTDYLMHPLCIKECIDAYVLPHENLIEDAINRGIERKKIFPLGIPVEEKFLEYFERKSILNEFGLKDKMTFLIMGGSLGLGEIEGAFFNFMKSRRDFQIIVVTGANKKLRKKLEKRLESIHNNKDVSILGYTDKINKLMDVADCIVTKPGGLTMAESLIKQIPICIISPIPGHEERTSNFLINCGVASRLEQDCDIDNFLNQVMDNEFRIDRMKKNAENLAKPNACRDIYNLMCKLIMENNLKRGVDIDISHSYRNFCTDEKI